MKRYRLTKITVKTRKIVSAAKTAPGETEIPVCPVCHSPFLTVSTLPTTASSAAVTESKTTAAELPPLKRMSSESYQLKNK